MKKIAIITTHPIQYQLPLFKNFYKNNIEAHVFFASSHGISSQNKDREFQIKFNWDNYKKPLSGYKSFFSKNQQYSIFDFRLSFKDLEKYLKKNKYEAIIIFGWNNLLYLKSIYFGKKLGIKTILRVETNLETNISITKKILKYLILRILFKFIDAFLYIGSLNKYFYLKHGVPKSKLYYAPYFVDNNFFKKKNKHNYLSNKLKLKNKKFILFVGKLIDRKKPQHFINLAEEFKNIKQLHFLLIGDGHLKNFCKEYIKKYNINNISMLGFQNQKNLKKIYQSSDLFVITSAYETWGLVINEAMASGLPILASNKCGSSKDLVLNGVTGYIYQYGNLKDLSRNFKKIQFNYKKKKLMKKNSKKIISNFTYDKTISSIKHIIN
tara:strand:- start:697 stop:1839 length:1143 start_codon:yes stop_codon:yes gene_type:complete